MIKYRAVRRVGRKQPHSPAWDALRRALLRRRQELIAQMRGELANSRPEGAGPRSADLCDQADDAFYGELAQGFAEIASADLRMIDRAIERIQERTYGLCVSCGCRIPEARLRILPFAELCVACKEEEERNEARYRLGLLTTAMESEEN